MDILVDHFAMGQEPTTYRRLDVTEVTALDRCFQARSVSMHDQHLVELLLDEMIAGNLWLACQCSGDLPLCQRPLMTSNENGYFVTMGRGRPSHSPNCRFRGWRPDKDRVIRITGTKAPKVPTFSMLRPFADLRVRGQNREGNAGPSQNRSSSLAQLLFTLIETAKLNSIEPGELPARRDNFYQGLVDAAVRTPFVDDNPINKWLVVHESQWDKLAKRIRYQKEWPLTSRPHGFVIGLSNAINERTLHFYNSEKIIKARPAVFYPYPIEKNEIKGPLLFCALLGQLNRDKDYVDGLRAYAHPIYSYEAPFILDSQMEKRTLDLLLKFRDEIIGPKYTIYKPLFENIDLEWKPDFELRFQNMAPIIIETWGMNDPSYENDKNAIYDKLGITKTVIIHDCRKSAVNSDDDFIKALKEALGVQ